MKKLLPVLLLIFIFFRASGQNFPACDSLVINCCTYNMFGPNTVTLTVTNNSSVLFDYPVFVLFNSNMDTIAIETLTYFGIGTSPQPHTMNIVAPLNLPFTGFLNLYTLLFDTLACSFPITIPDTVTGISMGYQPGEDFMIKPNPVFDSGIITVETSMQPVADMKIGIMDMTGRSIPIEPIKNDFGFWELNIQTLNPGIYILLIEHHQKIYTRKIVKKK